MSESDVGMVLTAIVVITIALIAAGCRFFNVVQPVEPAWPTPPVPPAIARYVVPEELLTDWYPSDAEHKPKRIGEYITKYVGLSYTQFSGAWWDGQQWIDQRGHALYHQDCEWRGLKEPPINELKARGYSEEEIGLMFAMKEFA